MKLVSACLIGINCCYDGKANLNKKCLKLFKKGELIPVCPEQLGGLPTPRLPQQIQKGTGKDVLNKKAKVRNKTGKDVTKNFIRGAKETSKIAKNLGIKETIFKARSPSCGSGLIYDGSFQKRLVKGDGVTAALLKKNKIKVITEEEL